MANIDGRTAEENVRVYSHSFRVDAPLEAVVDFHSRRLSLTAITPPLIPMQVHRGPDRLGEGDEVEFTMWLGPLPIRWLARIQRVTERSFQDVQLQGPFHAWLHTHTFVPLADGGTQVLDRVEAVLGRGLYRRFLSLNMWLGLPLLFAYRGWKSRRLLSGSSARMPEAVGAEQGRARGNRGSHG